MNISELYELYEEANNIFRNTSNPHARDALAQSLTVTGRLIPLWEAGDEEERKELEADIQDAILAAREKIEIALKLIDEIPDTLRSGDINPEQND